MARTSVAAPQRMKQGNAAKAASEGATAPTQDVVASSSDLGIKDALSFLTGAGAGEDRKMAVAVEEIEQVQGQELVPENDQGTNTEVVGDPEAWRAYLASDKQRETVASYDKQITEFIQQQETGNSEVTMLEKMIESRAGGAPRKKALETELKALKDRIARAAENQRITTDKRTKLFDAAKGKMDAAGEKTRNAAQAQRDKASTSAIARYEEYHITPLTSAQHERRTQLEEQGRQALAEAGSRMLAFCDVINTIYKEKLWIDHEGGLEGYMEEAFQIKKSQMYRDIAVSNQLEALRVLMSKQVRYLDASGKPEKVALNADKLPTVKGQLDKLARYGSTENQLKVWEQVAMECEANQVPASEKIIRRVGDSMVASGEVAIGLDAELQKAQQEAAAARIAAGGEAPKISPLNFNVWENIALWGGHEFAVRSYKTQAGVKKFEPRVDHVQIQRAGEVVLFDTLLAATKLLEEESRRLVTDQWTDVPVTGERDRSEDKSAPDPAENGAGADVTAAPTTAPVTSVADGSDRNVTAKGKKATTWYVGMDADKPEVFDHDTAKKGEPTTTETGYDAIVGPFSTKVDAIAYMEKIRTGEVTAPVAA